MANVIQVVAAVVDTKQLTLYKVDGTTVVIPQGDVRVARIVSEVTPILAPANGAVASVDISTENHYSNYEKKSGGLVKLFRVARNLLNSLFPDEPETVRPGTVGAVPDLRSKEAAVAEVMKHAVPANHPDFHDDGTDGENATHTIVASVDGVLIPGAENLKTQMANASATGSTVGLDNFMKRMALVAGKRQHSVQDLLNFMKRGDLPIADDGCIIIYKALRRSGDGYVDIHSGRVPQKIGSFVHMDESLVDHNRRNECSNGLHVARRQYLRGFPGDVCVLAKVRPEDAIAVPEYDANKMRVCGYHILFELTPEDYSALKSNRPFTSNAAAQKMLGAVMSGDHVGIKEFVKITEQRGGGIQITPGSEVGTIPAATSNRVASAIGEDADVAAPALDVQALAASVAAVKQQSRADKAQGLYMEYQESANEADAKRTAQALMDFKRNAKVSWATLGLPSNLTVTLNSDGAE
jgi:hypothetical protein